MNQLSFDSKYFNCLKKLSSKRQQFKITAAVAALTLKNLVITNAGILIIKSVSFKIDLFLY